MKRALLLIVLLCLFAAQAHAARGFGTTFGTNASDFISSGTITIGTQFSISVWIAPHNAGGSGFGYIVTDSNTGSGSLKFGLEMNNASNSILFQRGWSTSNPNWSFPLAAGADKWSHIMVTYDGGSAANNPVAYVNCVLQTVSRQNAVTGTLTSPSSPITFGGLNGAAAAGNNYDGRTAEFALWNNTLLSANDDKALCGGASPLFVRHTTLSIYVPLLGAQAGEYEWGPSHFATTVSNAKFQPHAPVQNCYPAGKCSQ